MESRSNQAIWSSVIGRPLFACRTFAVRCGMPALGPTAGNPRAAIWRARSEVARPGFMIGKVSEGRIVRLQGSPQEGPDSAP
jgi:hypothetical protein